MHAILTTIFERLAMAVITLLIVSVLIFSSVALLPGDFAKAVLGQSATTPATVTAFEQQIGLDRPATERYFNWLAGAVRGDFGNSFASRPGAERRVIDIIGPRLRNTLTLAGLTAAIAIPLAISLGLLAALWRNSWYDRIINATTLTTISVPEFFVAYHSHRLHDGEIRCPMLGNLLRRSDALGVERDTTKCSMPIRNPVFRAPWLLSGIPRFARSGRPRKYPVSDGSCKRWPSVG
ncbi:ABC transporter permease [Sinorhizobium meliloti]|uniref:ABC transporter permease n=1 Tax=Rhizobium meliloti TaxID=382 RepID=UPI001F20074F|nr:ABC transporter permease [Sinorhizobium meliloti]